MTINLTDLLRLHGTAFLVSLILGIVWLICLIGLLRRTDLEPVTKFMWVFVVITTTVLGAILYWCIAPKAPQRQSEPVETHDGPHCVSCGDPIASNTSVCPKCGWTQPARTA